MRGLLWIVAIALLGAGALLYAWRLVPAGARTSAAPTASAPASAPREPAEPLAPVRAQTAADRATAERVEPDSGSEPDRPAPVASGLEDGAAPAARPLPDFSDKYAGMPRYQLHDAAVQLDAAIALARKALTPVEQAELDARLAGRPIGGPPTTRVAPLLAQSDELAWLRQRLELPAARDPDALPDDEASGSPSGG